MESIKGPQVRVSIAQADSPKEKGAYAVYRLRALAVNEV